jgi:hypothetical protein
VRAIERCFKRSSTTGTRQVYWLTRTAAPLARLDDQPVWSVVCFYIDRHHGATIVEGYPSKPGDDDPFTGLEAMFAAAGFAQVRPGERCSIWRYVLTDA